jgi:hypothetical protein
MPLRALAAAALLAASTITAGCADRPTDIQASNTEDTDGYTVLAERQDGGALHVRIRLDNLDDANRVAEKVIEQKKRLNYARMTLEFVGREDPPDGPARRTRTWSRDGAAPTTPP